MNTVKRYVLLLCIAICLVMVGSFLAYLVHTNDCKVKITDMTYVTEDGARMRALLYVPDSATVENPAPAIVSCHLITLSKCRMSTPSSYRGAVTS